MAEIDRIDTTLGRVDAAKLEAACKMLTEWFGRSWDELREEKPGSDYKVWPFNGIGDYTFRGSKQDVREFVTRLVGVAVAPSPLSRADDGWALMQNWRNARLAMCQTKINTDECTAALTALGRAEDALCTYAGTLAAAPSLPAQSGEGSDRTQMLEGRLVELDRVADGYYKEMRHAGELLEQKDLQIATLTQALADRQQSLERMAGEVLDRNRRIDADAKALAEARDRPCLDMHPDLRNVAAINTSVDIAFPVMQAWQRPWNRSSKPRRGP